MQKFIVRGNRFLNKQMSGYYNCEYIGYNEENNPNYLNTIKNQFGNTTNEKLEEAYVIVKSIFSKDLKLLQSEIYDDSFIVMCVPRSKASFKFNQLYFQQAISDAVEELRDTRILNGTKCIQRVKDTKTTHIKANLDYFTNNGKEPYPGITKDTCEFNCNHVAGKTILLVDDIYTRGVNIDEDCIQLLYDNGASNVVLYVIAKTKEGH